MLALGDVVACVRVVDSGGTMGHASRANIARRMLCALRWGVRPGYNFVCEDCGHMLRFRDDYHTGCSWGDMCSCPAYHALLERRFPKPTNASKVFGKGPDPHTKRIRDSHRYVKPRYPSPKENKGYRFPRHRRA